MKFWHLNWRRGLFRLWSIGAVVFWIYCAVVWFDMNSQYSDAEHALEALIAKEFPAAPAPPPGFYPVGADGLYPPEYQQQFDIQDRINSARKTFWMLLLLPIAALTIGLSSWFSMRWVFVGFKSNMPAKP